MASVTQPYATAFQQIIQRNLEFVLAKVGTVESALSADLREQAFHTLSYGLNTPTAWSATQRLLLSLSPKLEPLGYWQEWILYLEQGVIFCREQADAPIQALLNLQLGRFYRLCNRLEEAYTCLTASTAAFAEQHDPHHQAEALAQLAYVARRRRQNAEASRLIQHAFTLCAPGSWAHAACYSIRGAIALDTHQFADAVSAYQQALPLWQQLQEQAQIAWAYNDLGVALNYLTDYAAAIPHLEQAIHYFALMQATAPQGVAHMNLGISYLELGEPQQALTAFDAAAPLLFQSQDEHFTPLLYHNRARACRHLQQWVAAEEACQAAIVRFREQQGLIDLANALDELGWIYREQHRLTDAITAFELGLATLDLVAEDPELPFFRKMLMEDLQAARQAAAKG